MVNEDFERDFLKDSVYLQEEVMLFKQMLQEEVERNDAIIKLIKDNGNTKANISEVGTVAPARIQLGYDLPFEAYRTRSRSETTYSE
jgi:hypothetical protein